MNGLVYYLLCKTADGVLLKIGMTTCLTERLRSLRYSEPYIVGFIVPLAVEYGGNRAERHRHAQFADERVHREWFRTSGRLLAFVASLGPIEDQWRAHDMLVWSGTVPELNSARRAELRERLARAV